MVTLEKDSYPNSPVVEVAWEIRFSNPDLIDLGTADSEFIPKLKKDYPDMKHIRGADFRVSDPLSQKPKFEQFKPTISGFELSSENHKNLVKVTTGNLVVVTRQHTNFKDFFKSITSVINMFSTTFESLDIPDISRVGLRYVNVCELPEKDKNQIEKYLLLPIDFNRFSVENMAAFRYETLQHSDSMSLRSIYQSAVIERVPKVIIDLDSFLITFADTASEETWRDVVLKQTGELHKLIKRMFQDSITEAFVNEVMDR